MYEKDYTEDFLQLKIKESKQAVLNKGLFSKNRKGIPRKLVGNRKVIKIQEFDLEGNLIKIWDDAVIAAKFYNISSGQVYKCAKGENKTLLNRIFIFENDSVKDRLEDMYQLYQFDFDGNFISKYFGPKDAESKLNIRSDMISNAARMRKIVHAGNFIWIYKADYTEKLLQDRLNLINRIGCFKDEILIKRFSSIKDSLDFLDNKVSSSSIHNCLNGWSKTSGGYMWKYLT